MPGQSLNGSVRIIYLWQLPAGIRERRHLATQWVYYNEKIKIKKGPEIPKYQGPKRSPAPTAESGLVRGT
ncbi:MAG: hypothetical protein PHD72_03815 [Patescibacteria group bacterium]|nr:hypothetical protein [Patescibacteria group bacterium]